MLRIIPTIEEPEEDAMLIRHVDAAGPLRLAKGRAGDGTLLDDCELTSLEWRQAGRR